MLAIYRTAWRCAVQNWPLFLLGAGLFIAVDVFKLATESRGTGTLAAWFVYVYGLHRALLLGEDWRGRTARPNLPKQAIGLFLWVALLLVGLGLVVPVGVLFWTVISTDVPEDLYGGLAVFLIAVFVAAYALVLSIFGTALPAAAVRDHFGLRVTWARARRTALGVLAGLLVGPGLFWTLTFSAQVALAMLIGPIPALYEDGAGFNLAGLLWRVPVELLTLFNAMLTVAVLCRAYRKVAPPEVLAVLQPDLGQAMHSPQAPA